MLDAAASPCSLQLCGEEISQVRLNEEKSTEGRHYVRHSHPRSDWLVTICVDGWLIFWRHVLILGLDANSYEPPKAEQLPFTSLLATCSKLQFEVRSVLKRWRLSDTCGSLNMQGHVSEPYLRLVTRRGFVPCISPVS